MKQLPDDYARCTNPDCENIDQCARHTIHYTGHCKRLSIFCPIEVPCKFFIDGRGLNEQTTNL